MNETKNKMQQQLKKPIRLVLLLVLVLCLFSSINFNREKEYWVFDTCKNIRRELCKKNILLSTTKDSVRLVNIDTHAPIWITNQPKIINKLRVNAITVCCQTTYTSTSKPYRFCLTNNFYYKDKVIYEINEYEVNLKPWLVLKGIQQPQYLYETSLGQKPILEKVEYCPMLKDTLYHVRTTSTYIPHRSNGSVAGFVFSEKYGIVMMEYDITTQGGSTYILK